MGLLNAAMALGTLAFVVPLAIHLLFKSRFRSIDWGAMFLLQDVIKANRRRMQWHQWILLALRCAIPILLALAMARPLISSMQSMPGSDPVSLVMVVDDSRSMSAGDRLTRTVDAAGGLLDSLSRRDEVLVLTTGSLNEPVSIGSPREARAKLRRMRFDADEMNLAATLRAATRAADQASHPHRRIVLISDFQAGGIAGTTSILEAVETLSDQLDSMTPRPQFDWLNIAEADIASGESLNNVYVESLQTDSPVILVNRPTTFIATVRNDSDQNAPGLRCNWLIDGRVIETQTVSLQPRESVTTSWRHSFDRQGGASVTFAVEHTDALAADNVRRLAVDVIRQVRVWLVDGAPSQMPLQSETDFLKVALSPFAFQATAAPARASQRTGTSPKSDGAGRSVDVVSTKIFSEREFLKELQQNPLDGFAEDQSASESKGRRGKRNADAAKVDFPDLVVLANVRRPPGGPDSGSRRGDASPDDPLANYLRSGGRIVFFDGDQVDAPAWSDCSWLPARPLNVLGESPDQERAGQQDAGQQEAELQNAERADSEEGRDSGFRIQPPGGRFAAWALLGDDRDSLLDSVTIGRLRAIAPRADSTVLVRTRSGEPLMVSRLIRPAGTGNLAADPAADPDKTADPEGESGGKPEPDGASKKNAAPAGPDSNMADSPETGSDGLGQSSGRVVQFAIPCDGDWSDLPLRPVYLPMMQQLVLDMAGSNEPLVSPVGRPIVITDEAIRRTYENEAGSESERPIWRIKPPDSAAISIEAPADRPIIYTATSSVGVYQFTRDLADGSLGSAADDGSTENGRQVNGNQNEEGALAIDETASDRSRPSIVRVVEVTADESRLQTIAPEVLAEAAKRLGARTFGDASGLITAANRDRFGLEIWRPLIALLLAVMIGEVLWQQLAMSRRIGGGIFGRGVSGGRGASGQKSPTKAMGVTQ